MLSGGLRRGEGAGATHHARVSELHFPHQPGFWDWTLGALKLADWHQDVIGPLAFRGHQVLTTCYTL